MQNYRDTKADWPISLEELNARSHQCNKPAPIRSNRFAIYIAIFFSILFFSRLLRRCESEVEVRRVGMVIYVLIFFILNGGVLLVAHTRKKNLKAYDLVCPSCSKLLYARKIMPIAIATGHCCNCGAQLVKDHPSMTGQGAPDPPATDPDTNP